MSSWPGFFVSFEGGDGAGKTTLIQGLSKTLRSRGIECLLTREPGGTALGDGIRHLVLHASAPIVPDAELALFLAARAQHIQERILPALKQGQVVLCDRFNDSTIAYQGFGRQVGWQRVQQLCQLFCGEVLPQLTFYLDLHPAVGLERAQGGARGALDRMEMAGMDYHQRVRAGFLQIAAQEPDRIHVIDASESPEVVLQQAEGILRQALGTRAKAQ